MKPFPSLLNLSQKTKYSLITLFVAIVLFISTLFLRPIFSKNFSSNNSSTKENAQTLNDVIPIEETTVDLSEDETSDSFEKNGFEKLPSTTTNRDGVLIEKNTPVEKLDGAEEEEEEEEEDIEGEAETNDGIIIETESDDEE